MAKKHYKNQKSSNKKQSAEDHLLDIFYSNGKPVNPDLNRTSSYAKAFERGQRIREERKVVDADSLTTIYFGS